MGAGDVRGQGKGGVPGKRQTGLEDRCQVPHRKGQQIKTDEG